MSGGYFNYPGDWDNGFEGSIDTVKGWDSIVAHLEADYPDAPGCKEFVFQLKAVINMAKHMRNHFKEQLKETLTDIDLVYSCDYGPEDMIEALAKHAPK